MKITEISVTFTEDYNLAENELKMNITTVYKYQ